MTSHISRAWLRCLLVLSLLPCGGELFAQGNGNPDPPGPDAEYDAGPEEGRPAAGGAAGQRRLVPLRGPESGDRDPSPLAAGPGTLAAMTPGAPPDYFGVGNYANSLFPTVDRSHPGHHRAHRRRRLSHPSSPSPIPDGDRCHGDGDLIKSGVIASITVTSGGSNYSNPVVTITDNGNAAGATAFVSSFGSIIGGIRKFVDTLPGLTQGGANNLGEYIPLAVVDTRGFTGSDYYRLGLKEFTHKFHSDLPAAPTFVATST